MQRRSYLIDVLDKAGWDGPQYQLARNSYLLDLYRDELPDDAREVRRFACGHPLVAGPPEEIVARVCARLEAEFGLAT